SHFAHLLRPSLCLPAHTRPYSLRASRNPRPQRCTRRAPEAHNAPWGPAIVCEDRYCFGVLVIAPLHSALNFDSLFFRHCSAGILDNTLVYYIIGDNGGSAEGTLNGTFNEMLNFNGMSAIETPEFLEGRIDKFGGTESYN